MHNLHKKLINSTRLNKQECSFLTPFRFLAIHSMLVVKQFRQLDRYRQCCFTLTQCQSVSTFESEVQNSLSALESRSMDSLGHQHRTKKLSPKIALHFKVLCESKAMLKQCGIFKLPFFAHFSLLLGRKQSRRIHFPFQN